MRKDVKPTILEGLIPFCGNDSYWNRTLGNPNFRKTADEEEIDLAKRVNRLQTAYGLTFAFASFAYLPIFSHSLANLFFK